MKTNLIFIFYTYSKDTTSYAAYSKLNLFTLTKVYDTRALGFLVYAKNFPPKRSYSLKRLNYKNKFFKVFVTCQCHPTDDFKALDHARAL